MEHSEGLSAFKSIGRSSLSCKLNPCPLGANNRIFILGSTTFLQRALPLYLCHSETTMGAGTSGPVAEGNGFFFFPSKRRREAKNYFDLL